MERNSTTESAALNASEIAGGIAAVGTWTMALFPFAIPALILTIPLVAPLALIGIILAIPAALAAGVVAAIRAMARRIRSRRQFSPGVRLSAPSDAG